MRSCSSCIKFLPGNPCAIPGNGICIFYDKLLHKSSKACANYVQKTDRSAIKLRQKIRERYEEAAKIREIEWKRRMKK